MPPICLLCKISASRTVQYLALLWSVEINHNSRELTSVDKITQNSYCTLLWRARGVRADNWVQGQSPWSRGQGAKPP